jgi:hypothetical protein
MALHLDGRSVTRRVLLATALVASALAINGATARAAAEVPDFGPNVKIFDPSMSTSAIKAAVDAIASRQVSNQFGTERDAVLFMPGTYGSAASPLSFEVGYYTEVAGLGSSPSDVSVTGTIDSFNQCFPDSGCHALVNFWRSVSNLTINVNTAAKKDCRAAGEFWATSQAAPMRRVHVNGFATLMDFCPPGPFFASGGFIADSQFSGSTIVNGSQQQYLVRNSDIDGWTNGVWNQVFAGVKGAPAQTFPRNDPGPYTTLATTPASREKPFLYVDSNNHFNVFVPDASFNSSGTTWAVGQTPGHSLPIESFFIAKATDTVQSINNALSRGMNLLFTPGVYDIDKTIKVKRADTVVLGLGMATLTAQNGVVPMTVADVKGVDVAGLIFDAGPQTSPALLEFGDDHGSNLHGEATDPGALQDVFFRIGGPHAGSAVTSLVVGQDNTILDDIWAWRADHGNGVGWTVNTADTGVVVTGDNVVATGLFVEHFQKNEVFWAGENGKTIMFQNEMPYDPPNQAAWQHDGLLGWAAYKVADGVKTHEGWGLGSYCFLNVNPSIHATHAFEVPVTTGVKLHDILSLSITNHGTIDHVVNDFGPATNADTVPVDVVSYP